MMHAIRGDVLKAQADGLRHAQSRACEQGEERAVGLSSERMTGLSHRLDKTDNVVRGKDVRDGPRCCPLPKTGGGTSWTLILGTHVPGEANHLVEAAGPLVD